MVEHFVLLITQQHGATGVDIQDAPVVLFLNAHNHDGVTRVGPVLQHYFVL